MSSFKKLKHVHCKEKIMLSTSLILASRMLVQASRMCVSGHHRHQKKCPLKRCPLMGG